MILNFGQEAYCEILEIADISHNSSYTTHCFDTENPLQRKVRLKLKRSSEVVRGHYVKLVTRLRLSWKSLTLIFWL